MDKVFHALAHDTRRQILDYVMANPGCLANDIAGQFETSRIAVRKHIKILEESNLLITEKEGRNSHHYFNPVPIQLIYDRWTNQYSQFFASKLTSFKLQVESDSTEEDNEKTA